MFLLNNKSLFNYTYSKLHNWIVMKEGINFNPLGITDDDMRVLGVAVI